MEGVDEATGGPMRPKGAFPQARPSNFFTSAAVRTIMRSLGVGVLAFAATLPLMAAPGSATPEIPPGFEFGDADFIVIWDDDNQEFDIFNVTETPLVTVDDPQTSSDDRSTDLRGDPYGSYDYDAMVLRHQVIDPLANDPLDLEFRVPEDDAVTGTNRIGQAYKELGDLEVSGCIGTAFAEHYLPIDFVPMIGGFWAFETTVISGSYPGIAEWFTCGTL